MLLLHGSTFVVTVEEIKWVRIGGREPGFSPVEKTEEFFRVIEENR